MINTRQEVQAALVQLLTDVVDPSFEEEGFLRRSGSSSYSRKTPDAVQEIAFVFDLRPSGNPEAVAYLLPNLTIFFPEVSRVALEMVGGDARLLANAPEITLWQQFHVAAPGGRPTYWYLYGDDRDSECIEAICEFAGSWVRPLLNDLTQVESVVQAYESNNERVLKQRHFYLYVAAAYVLLGHPEKAGQVLDERFGRPGGRRTHAKAFAYVDQLLAG